MRRWSKAGIPAAVLALGVLLALTGTASDDEAARLLESRRAEDLLRAAEIFEARAAEDPDRFEARLGVARALNSLMALRTNGNLPLVDGLQDSDAHRAIWGEHAPRALAHARRAAALRPDSAAAAASLANAYMFYSSSLGIVSAILQGASGEYRQHARRLVELDARYDDGLGDYLLASFYLVAPWPIGDSDEARAGYERALERSPESVRNHYGLAVYWAREGEEGRARAHFEQVRSLPCTAHSERLFCGWMKREAGSYLSASEG